MLQKTTLREETSFNLLLTFFIIQQYDGNFIIQQCDGNFIIQLYDGNFIIHLYDGNFIKGIFV
jgi:hypothetical protein